MKDLNVWNYAITAIMSLITIGLGIIGYFLRRIITQFDASQAAQAKTHDLAQAAKGESERAIQLAGDAATASHACRDRHDQALTALRRDLGEQFVRKDDFSHMIGQLGKLEGMMNSVAVNLSGLVSTTEGIKERLEEGNGRFERIEEHMGDHNTRISRLEGRGTEKAGTK